MSSTSLRTNPKGCFTFRLAAPSFLFPASWAVNSRAMASCVDEVELLFFSSQFPDDLPPEREIETLGTIAERHAIRYNVHLPIDIHPGSPAAGLRKTAAETIGRYVDLTACLQPTTWTLHLPWEPGLTRRTWGQNIRETLTRVLATGYPARAFSIETLDYPLEWAEEIIAEFDLSVCVDIGHLIRYGQPLAPTVEAWRNRIAIFHLHGVCANRDHAALDRLSPTALSGVRESIASFSGSVVLEVFSLADFQSSVRTLLAMFCEDAQEGLSPPAAECGKNT